MDAPLITENCVVPMLETPFLRVFDLQYAPGRHYYDATRRTAEQLVAPKSEEAFQAMTADAVTCVVVLQTPGRNRGCCSPMNTAIRPGASCFPRRRG